MKKLILTTLLLGLLAMPVVALAVEPAPIKLGVEILGKTTTTGLGEYIGLWYSFITGVVGILATIMIMWGGFKWLTSRGNSSIIGEAKEIIFSAIIGLFLALMSFSILNLINPALVNVGGGLSLSGIGKTDAGGDETVQTLISQTTDPMAQEINSYFDKLKTEDGIDVFGYEGFSYNDQDNYVIISWDNIADDTDVSKKILDHMNTIEGVNAILFQSPLTGSYIQIFK